MADQRAPIDEALNWARITRWALGEIAVPEIHVSFPAANFDLQLEDMRTSDSDASARLAEHGHEVQVEAMEGSDSLLAPERGGQSDEGS